MGLSLDANSSAGKESLPEAKVPGLRTPRLFFLAVPINQVTLFQSGPSRGASHPCVLVVWSEASLLMAVLQIFADFLHLSKVFNLPSDEVMYSVRALVVGAW